MFTISRNYTNYIIQRFDKHPLGGFQSEKQVIGFVFSNVPYCCGTEELGHFGVGTTKEEREAVIKHYFDYRLKTAGGPGLVIAHFVKPNGGKEYTSKEWIESLMEAGFKEGIPEFENHVHPGNMIRQLYYVHAKKSNK